YGDIGYRRSTCRCRSRAALRGVGAGHHHGLRAGPRLAAYPLLSAGLRVEASTRDFWFPALVAFCVKPQWPAWPIPARPNQPASTWVASHLVSPPRDRKSTRLNSSHVEISYAVFCLKKKR